MNPNGHPLEPDSSTGKVREFFAANPGAELTPHQLSKMLDLTKVQVYNVMRNLKAQGICESVRIIRVKR